MVRIPLKLGPRLSSVSWIAIESFCLLALSSLPFSKSVAEISVVTALALWTLRKFPFGEPFPVLPVFNVSYLLFLFFTAVSLTQVPHTLIDIGWRGYLKWLKFIGIFFMTTEMCRDAHRTRRFIAAFLVSMTLACLNGFYQIFAGQDLVKQYSIDVPGRFLRMRSSFGSANSLAAFLLFALPISFWLWGKKGRWDLKKLLFVLLAIFFGVSFILTLSRAAFVALVGAVFLYALSRGGKNVAYFLGGLALLLILFYFSGTLGSNFLTSLNLEDKTVRIRMHFWDLTLGMIREHPFIGSGVNMFYQKFPVFTLGGRTYHGYAHNCYLQMWSEIGVFGLLAFLWPFATTLGRRLWRTSEPTGAFPGDALWIGITAFLIQGLFDTVFYSLQTAMLFWLHWGAYTAQSRPSSRRS